MATKLSQRYNNELLTKAWVEQIISDKLNVKTDYKQLTTTSGNTWLQSDQTLHTLGLTDLVRGTAASEFVGTGVTPVGLRVRGAFKTTPNGVSNFGGHRVLLVQALTADLTAGNVLDLTTTTITLYPHLAPRKLTGITTFNILVDKLIEVPIDSTEAGGNGFIAMWDMYVPGKAMERIEVVPGAGVQAKTRGALFLLYTTGAQVAATTTLGLFSAYAELVYTDDS